MNTEQEFSPRPEHPVGDIRPSTSWVSTLSSSPFLTSPSPTAKPSAVVFHSAFSLLPGLFESHNCEDNSSDKFSSSRRQNSSTSGKAEKANNEIELKVVAASCILDFITPL